MHGPRRNAHGTTDAPPLKTTSPQLTRPKEPLPNIVLALSAARFCAGVGGGAVLMALTERLDEVAPMFINASENIRVGMVAAIFGLCLGLGQPLVGWASRMVTNLRTFVLAGISLFFLSSLGLAWAESFQAIATLRAVQGLALACTIPTILSLISSSVPREARGRAMGLYGTARMVGFGAGALYGGWLLEQMSANEAFLWSAFPDLFAVGLIWVFVPRTSDNAAEAVENTTSDERGRLGAKKDWIFVYLGGLFALMACCVSMLIALEESFSERLSLSPRQFSVAFSAMILVRVCSDYPAGKLSDRIGRAPLIRIGLFLLAPTVLMMGFAPTYERLIAARLAIGLCMSGIVPSSFALAGDLARGSRRTFQLSLVSAGFGIGLAAGPLLTALMAEKSGFYAPFILYAALCVVAASLPVVGRSLPVPSSEF